MTKFDTDLASRGWALIAEGAQMVSLAYAANEPAVARAAVPAAEGTSAPSGYASAPADDFPPLPPLEEPPGLVDYQPKGANLDDQNTANVLSKCPTHDKPWTVKEGGVSKAGKPYNAFWKCGEKDPNTRSGYCDKKPVKAWADAHPIQEAA